MDYNRLTKQVIAFVTGFIAFFFLLGFAGTSDYNEHVVHTMPQEAYEAVYLKLGDGCSNGEIVKEYMSNREYYDSLSN